MPARSPKSRTFDDMLRTERARELDRSAWPGLAREIFVFDTYGTGTTQTPLFTFSNRFEQAPFMDWMVEILPGWSISGVDAPYTSAGVLQWVSTVLPRGGEMYQGAQLFVAIKMNDPLSEMGLRWRFSFEGIVLRNNEYIGS